MDNITDHLVLGFKALSGNKYASICHRPPNTSMPGAPCFTDVTSSTTRSSILTLSFIPGSTNDFIDAVKQHAHFAEDKFGVKYHVEGRQVETIGEMRSGKWVAYAARALVVRFWDLAKVSCFRNQLRNMKLTICPSVESGLTRYSARPRRLHFDAYDIHPALPVFSRTRLQFLVNDSDRVIVDLSIHARSPDISICRYPT